MDQAEKGTALEDLMKTPGWTVLNEYHRKRSQPEILPIDTLDSLIKQAYQNGICAGHRETLDYVKAVVDNYKRKNSIANKPIKIDGIDFKK